MAACTVEGESVLLARPNQPSLSEAHLRWELPGGKVQIGETPDQALRRKIQEELGTRINVLRLLPHLQNNICHRDDGSIADFLVIAFETVLARGAPKPKVVQDSVKQFRWVPRSEVSQLELLPGTDKFLECLERLAHASFDEAQSFIRLERQSEGRTTD